MKRSQTHLTILLTLFLALALATACSNGSDRMAAKATEEPAPAPAPPAEDTTAVEEPADTTDATTPAGAEEGETAPAEETETGPAPTSPAGGGTGARSVDEERLAVILDLIAQDLEAQKLAYVSSLGQDCSGIYHKIKDMVQRKMSVLGDKSKYHYPSFTEDRNSRQIADWYYRNGNLHIVQDAKAECNRIRPGSVMFYGRTEEQYSNLTIELLTNPGKFIHDGTNGKIMHVAVVTKVILDEEGNVINYTIMHGRNSRHTASRTSGNHPGPGFDKNHARFPFGNWNQQWVAVANIETAKE